MNRSLLGKAVQMESAVWRSLFQWIGGKQGKGAHEFAYDKAANPPIWVFIAISAFEIPLLHLLLPTGWPRVLALVLGAWGLIWMFGLLASMKVMPHTVTEAGIRVRSGILLDITIPWDDIESVQLQKRTLTGTKTVQVSGDSHELVAHVAQASATNVAIELCHPMKLPLPKHPTENFCHLHLYTENPTAMINYIREFITREANCDNETA